MTELHKIIGFFIFIFITGIFISVLHINTTFKKQQQTETVKVLDSTEINTVKKSV